MKNTNLLLLLILLIIQLSISMAKFNRVQTQFIAALGNPKARKGEGASSWGIWRVDPGPRGVRLNNWNTLKNNNGVAPARWKFDANDWWLEEHGLIMEKPDFPLPSGRYVVTGGRETTSLLTIDGDNWELNEGTLYDVTHLPCRSARYTPIDNTTSDTGTPGNANSKEFPVTPGGMMPAVPGCKKQDYWVVFVTAIEANNL